jgi:ubiquinone/menaquinone biosynthesis C-methylase UbiE
MNWETFWNIHSNKSSNEFLEVGRYSNTKIVSEDDIIHITNYITEKLELQTNDNLLDVCCGNGLLSFKLANKVKSVVGIDISETLLLKARQRNNLQNATFIKGNALVASEILDQKFDKILLYFSFQYFDSFRKGEQVITQLKKLLNPNGIILIGDIPDAKRFHIYYPTLKSRLRRFLQVITKQEPMGKFWSSKELEKICKKLQLKGQYLKQPESFLYQHYRFDFIIKN